MLLIESLLAGGTVPASPLLFIWGSGQGGQLADTDSSGLPLDNRTYRSWSQVTMGISHVAAIRSDNLLFTWGFNDVGQLGLNDTVFNNSPTQIGTSSWIAVSAGRSHTLAIRQGGTLFAWGINSFGQLAQNDTINRSSPTQIGTSSWTTLGQFTNLTESSAAIRQGGTLFTWGANEFGQLGNGSLLNRSSPTQVGTSSWISVSISRSTGAAIRQGGTLFGFGSRAGGRLANYINGVTPPTNISWRQVYIGTFHSLGIDTNFKLWAWGQYNSGNLGFEVTNIFQNSPIQVGNSSWTAVRAAQQVSMAIRADGRLFTWGLNTSGQLGLDDTINRSSPTQVGTSSWTAISSVETTTFLAVRRDGALFGWGSLLSNYIVGAENVLRSSPTLVSSNSWTAISGGASQIVAANNLGQLFSWGSDVNGLTGNRNNQGFIIDNTSWVQIAAGSAHTLARSGQGTLWTWGSNNSWGQLGRPGLLAPQPLPGSWIWIDAGDNYSAGINSNGTLFTWGINVSGQLGLNDTLDRSSPTQVGTSSWTQVSLNRSSTAALRQGGTLFTWGLNQSGILGDGSQTNRSSPVQITSNSWKQVRMGRTHAVALDSTDKIWVWGEGREGALGLFQGNRQIYNTGSWTAIRTSQNSNFTMGLQGPKLYVWGQNNNGELGQDTQFFASISNPAVIPGSWTAIAAAVNQLMAIRNDGRLFSWGLNNNGELGLGDTIARSSPTQVGTSSWTVIAMGGSNAAAIRQGGTLFTWGSPDLLGDTSGVSRSSPVAIGASSWSQVRMGRNHVLAIRQNGSLFSWGRNTSGQLGNYDSANSPTGPASWIAVSADRSVFAIDSNGQLWGWGNGQLGALGLNNPTSQSRSRPLLISTSSWTAVATGGLTHFAIRQGGSLFAWGFNHAGMTAIPGLGLNESRSSPTQIGTSSWTAVYVAKRDEGGVLAIRQGGTLFAWGANIYGQLGLGDTFARSSPTQVGTSSWTQVSAGWEHSAAIRQGGTLFTWGRGFFGVLGLGDETNRSSPTQVGTSSWTQISASPDYQTAAIRQGGTLFTWGLNQNGALGLSNNQTVSSPTQVGTSSWTAVSAGYRFMSGIRQDGRLLGWGETPASGNASNSSTPNLVGLLSWGLINAGNNVASGLRSGIGWAYFWGINQFGQFGDGTNGSNFNQTSIPQLAFGLGTVVFSPIQIGTSSWTQVSAAENGSMAIRQGGTLFVWGENGFYGYLGLGETITSGRSSPTQLGSSSWTQVSTGGDGALAIRQDGAAFSWGWNYQGKYGFGDPFATVSSPTMLRAPAGAFGQSYVIADAGEGLNGTGYLVQTGGGSQGYPDRSLWGGGPNSSLLMGSNALSSFTQVASKSSLEPVQLGTDSWTAVGAGHQCTFAARPFEGTQFNARSWGWNEYFALGLGNNDTESRSSPQQVGAFNVVSFAVKQLTVLAGSLWPSASTTVWGWGLNQYGITGTTSPDFAVSNPTTVALNDTFPLSIATNLQNSFFAQSRVSIISGQPPAAWGWGFFTGLPNWLISSDSSSPSSPTLMPIWSRNSPNQIGLGQSWVQASVGQGSAVALNNIGQMWTWGNNNVGQLAQNDTTNRSSPTFVNFGDSQDVTAINMFGQCFQWRSSRSSGRIWGVGSNGLGQLGLGDNINRSSPAALAGTGWTGLAESEYFAAAAAGFQGNTNSFVAQGYGNPIISMMGWQLAGIQLSPAFFDADYTSSPAQVGTLSWSQVSMGEFHGIGITSTNALYSWGINQASVLGLGDSLQNLFRGSFTTVGSSSYTIVSAAGNWNLARKIDGTLVAWGTSGGGRFGDGSGGVRSAPSAAAAGSWISITTGTAGAMGISASNLLYGWGTNGNQGQAYSPVVVTANFPQLIYDATRFSPVQLGTFSWRQVSNNFQHTLAIRNDRTLWAWGTNVQGQLGLGSTVFNYSSPVQVGSSLWTAVATGDGQSLAIRNDGVLFAWGFNGSGQLGLSDNNPRSSPTQVGTSTWTAIQTGSQTSVAIRQGGTLFAWGANAGGEIGDGTTTSSRNSPVQIGSSSWTAISITNRHTMAIRADGALFAWGFNAFSQLGLDDFFSRSSPTQVGTSSWISVSAGRSYTLAIARRTATAGTLFAWGQKNAGVLGNGDTTGIFATSAVMGTNSTYVIDNQNRLFVFGSNVFGELGLGDNVQRLVQAQLPGSWIAVAGTLQNSMIGIRSNNTLWTWGRNIGGQLGLGDTIQRSSPVQLGTSLWTAVTGGQSHFLAIRQGGSLFAWGANGTGELGIGDTFARSSPTQVGTSAWQTLGVTIAGSAAIRQGGTLFTWGQPFEGLIGDGNSSNTAYRSSPVQIGTSSWVALSTRGGQYSLAAIRQGGTLFTWGWGQNGALGLGDTASRSSPTQVGTSSWTSVSSGLNQYFIGQLPNGEIYGWGVNNNGQIGVNIGTPQSSPTLISSTLKSFVLIAGNQTAFVAAQQNTGLVYGWGSAASGQLDNNLNISSNFSPFVLMSPSQFCTPSPVQIGSLSWTQVSAGQFSSAGITANNLLYTWGMFNNGVLGGPGSGSYISRSSPVQVGTSSWVAVYSGIDSITAITK